MTRKIVTGVIAAVLLVTIAVLAAEKVKEKVRAEKPRGGERGERFEHHEGLLDQLAEAYKANDREKMGQIINKMQERREKMREFTKINRWNKWAHHRMITRQNRFGWGQGLGMQGPGFNRGWAMQRPCGNWGCPMAGPRWEQYGAMNGCCRGPWGGRGPIANEFEQMPCEQGYMGMNNPMPPQGERRQMPGWGRGFERRWGPEQGEGNMGPQDWTPRRERHNVPPPEWGW
jgi:hypothetical protein